MKLPFEIGIMQDNYPEGYGEDSMIKIWCHMSQDGNPNYLFTKRVDDNRKPWIMETKRGSVILINPMFFDGRNQLNAKGKKLLLEKLHVSLDGWEYRPNEGLVLKTKRRIKALPEKPRPSHRSLANSASGQAKAAAAAERKNQEATIKSTQKKGRKRKKKKALPVVVTDNPTGSGVVAVTKSGVEAAEGKQQEYKCCARECQVHGRPAINVCSACKNRLHYECDVLGGGNPLTLFCSVKCSKRPKEKPRCCSSLCRQQRNTRFIQCVSCDLPLHRTCGFPVGNTVRSRDSTRICNSCYE